MAFYLFPPRGSVSLEKLGHMTFTRFKFLLAVYHCCGTSASMRDLVDDLEVAEESDILIEGSPKDEISHFTLRLACMQDSVMQDFFIETETMLFAYRISCMKEDELLRAVKPLRKLLAKVECSNEQLDPALGDACHMIIYMLHNRGWSKLISSFFNNADEYVTLPFQYVDELVARKCIVIQKGMAVVPIAKLCDMLVMLFQRLIKVGINKAPKYTQYHDARISSIIHGVKKLFRKSGLRQDTADIPVPITADQIDELSVSFPPCMSLIHQRLRQCHRLPHHARIRYTLFLKEAGLPLHEALLFWREEYSLPSSNGRHENGCLHSWETDSKRYTYNIRHLYGLEGSRKNYRGHTCSAIQSSCDVTENIGCPFKHFDNDNLRKFLKENMPANVDNSIIRAAGEHDYCCACKVYRNNLLQKLLKMTPSETPYLIDPILSGKETPIQNVICEGTARYKDELINTNTCTAIECAGLLIDQKKIENPLDCFKEEAASANSQKQIDSEISTRKREQNEVNAISYVNSKPMECPEVKPCRSNSSHVIRIYKPVDYYLSYKSMLDMLKSNKGVK